VVMNAGRVMQEGSPAELYDRPANAFVASFLGNINLLAARIAGVGPASVSVDWQGTIVELPSGGRSYLVGDKVTLGVRPENVGIAKERDARSLFQAQLKRQPLPS
jgi:ABC-type Fe3+/spermidine/putrescine transport system ATPase subunit